MKHIFTCLLVVFCALFTFSQTITFECNNEIITVSFDEITNNPNAYMDWDGDGLINENDYVIYLQDIYDCDDWSVGDDGCWEEGEFYCIGCELFIDDCTYVECEGPQNWSDWIIIDDCEENEITWNDIDWIVSDWEDFDWESVWDDLDLGTLVDWNNIPWDEIIDLNIFTDDFIDYIISIILASSSSGIILDRKILSKPS